MNLEPEGRVLVVATSASDHALSSLAIESAGGPALRSPASKIDARRDTRLLGGVYLCYRSTVLVTPAERSTGI